MHKSIIKLSLMGAVLVATLTACSSFYHNHMMRGSIVRVQKQEVTICIGTKDGAKVGQVLDVYVHEADPDYEDSLPNVESTKVGQIKITRVFNKHYAKAIVVQGKAPKGAVAEVEVRH